MFQVKFQNAGVITLRETATQILSFAKDKKIFCFYGELGAGKTTLIKEICKQLGVIDSGSSPTFSLVNEYRYSASALHNGKDVSGASVFHFDLYRVKNESEIYDIGYEEYFFSENYCFIEWPEKIERLLPKGIVKVRIEVNNSEREISIE